MTDCTDKIKISGIQYHKIKNRITSRDLGEEIGAGGETPRSVCGTGCLTRARGPRDCEGKPVFWVTTRYSVLFSYSFEITSKIVVHVVQFCYI